MGAFSRKMGHGAVLNKNNQMMLTVGVILFSKLYRRIFFSNYRLHRFFLLRFAGHLHNLTVLLFGTGSVPLEVALNLRSRYTEYSVAFYS